MRSSLRMLVWEMVWKHRVIFPALALFLMAGAGLSVAIASNRTERPWWLGTAEGVFLVAFLMSMLLSYAPFTLVETHGGWRMNSMITRWFTLPVRTSTLVMLPLGVAAGFMAAVMGLWIPWLQRVAGRGLDWPYFLATLIAGVVLMQAVAWSLPRRPGQYGAIAGLVMPITIFMALIPLERPDSADWRQKAVLWYLVLSCLSGAWAWYAAMRNRCGDWPGHLPLDRAGEWIKRPWRFRRPYRSATSALFVSETVPALWTLALSWILMAVLVFAWALSLRWSARTGGPRPLEVLLYTGVVIWPFVAMLWLAGWGLTLGNRPESGFRTSVTSFYGTLPVSAGGLAAPRLRALWAGWWMVWLPMVLLMVFCLPHVRGIWDYDGLEGLRGKMVWRMALSASLVAGGLPLLLAGRLEGFPNVLLTGLCAWAGVWSLAGFLDTNNPGTGHLVMAAVLIGLKFLIASCAAVAAWRRGFVTPRWIMALTANWLAVFGLLAWMLPTAPPHFGWRLTALALLVPFARLALCPLAMEANRCR